MEHNYSFPEPESEYDEIRERAPAALPGPDLSELRRIKNERIRQLAMSGDDEAESNVDLASADLPPLPRPVTRPAFADAATEGDALELDQPIYSTSINLYGRKNDTFGRKKRMMAPRKVVPAGLIDTALVNAAGPTSAVLNEIEDFLSQRDALAHLPPDKKLKLETSLRELKLLCPLTGREEGEIKALLGRAKHAANALFAVHASEDPSILQTLSSACDALHHAVTDVKLSHCRNMQDLQELVAAELSQLAPLRSDEALIQYITYGWKIVENPSQYNVALQKSDVQLFINILLDTGEMIALEPFHAVLDKFISWMVTKGDEEMLVKFLGGITERSVQRKQWEEGLKTVSHNQQLMRFLGNTKFSSEAIVHIANFFNYRIVSNSAPYSLTARLCHLTEISLGGDAKKLHELFTQIDFKMQSSFCLAHLLYVSFVGADGPATPDLYKRKVFFTCLITAQCIPFFNHPEVVQGCKSNTYDFFKSMLRDVRASTNRIGGPSVQPRGTSILDEVIGCEPEHYPLEHMVTAPFMLHSKKAIGLRHPAAFLKVMLYASEHVQPQEQEIIILEETKTGDSSTEIADAIDAVAEHLEALYLYWWEVSTQDPRHTKPSQIHSIIGDDGNAGKMYDLVIQRLYLIAKTGKGKGFRTVLSQVVDVAQHFLQMSKDEIVVILSKKGRLDMYSSSFDALRETIESVTTGDPWTKWDTRDLFSRIFYLYCFAKYPKEDFRGWFEEINFNIKTRGDFRSISREETAEIFSNFEQRREQLVGRKEVADSGFRCLQHNQVCAINVVFQQVRAGRNIFTRVGTGQGKSLIIALTAAQFAKEGHRVCVFTCYAHLAERDFKRFEPLYKQLGFKCCHIDGKQAAFSADVNIVYSDLQTYFQAMQSHALATASRSPSELDIKGYFKPHHEDVCILDEFDSLVLEHDIVCNTVYPINDVLTTDSMSRGDLDNERTMRAALLARNPELGTAFVNQRFSHFELSSGLDKWMNRGDKWKAGHEGIDALGKKVSYIGGRLYELKEKGTMYEKPLALNTLAFLKSFKFVVGLSGSIKPPQVTRFADLFSRPLCFVNIPQFYGKTSSNNVCRQQIRGMSNRAWQAAIRKDVEEILDKQRPVLVFANPEPSCSDWDTVETLLQSIAQERSCKMVKIKEERNVNETNLNLACLPNTITISSHVAGRGADFVVQPEVNRMGGLHVLISFEPKTNTDELDVRMEDQMMGRTARMHRNGTHSILVQSNYPPEEGKKVTIDEIDEIQHELSVRVFVSLFESPSRTSHWKRWALFAMSFPQLATVPKAIREVRVGKKGDEMRVTTMEERVTIVLNQLIADPERRSACSLM
eukprot:m.154824 g.154824  ORF g.154824 m.154824 type:complete len:1334 (-) comp20795_c1_seq4:26-4027(-)